MFISIAAAIPTGNENIQHHFGHGVSPFANAAICVTERIMKDIQNIINAGNAKYTAYFDKSSVASPCFERKTIAQTGT